MNIDAPVKSLIVAIEQPPEGYKLHEIQFGTHAHFVYISYGFGSILPLPLGAKVGVRIKGEHMPIFSISKWLTVSSVTVKQVKELTAEEIEAAGYFKANHPEFDKLPKTDIDTFAFKALLKQHPDWTPDTWVELAGLEELQ